MATKDYFLNVAGGVPGARSNAPTHPMAPAMAAKDPKDPTYNRTPAPIDYEGMKDNAYGRQNYGANAYGGPSSLTPGQAVKSEGIDAQGFDPVLEIIQHRSIAKDTDDQKPVDWELRAIGDKNCPDGFGQDSARSRQASTHSGSAVKVPDKIGGGVAPLPKTDQYGGTKS